jgi:hypothetical protein
MAKFIKILGVLVVVVGIAIIFCWAINPLEAPKWTGFAPYDTKLNAKNPKTLWDWLKLLIIPGAIAFGVWWLNYAEKKKDQETEKDRQYQAALESYLDFMAELLIKENLRNQKADYEGRIIARTRTLGLFKILDAGRKSRALQFLYESGLIHKNPVISLLGADLKGASLSYATLNGAEIRGAYLCKADLRGASLRKAILRGCDFSGADLRDCDLGEADLKGAILVGAKLKNVNTVGTDLSWTKLSSKKR